MARDCDCTVYYECLDNGEENEGMNHKKHWDELEESLIDSERWHSPKHEPGLQTAIIYVGYAKKRMIEEYEEEKKIISRIWWIGIPLFIYFLYDLTSGGKENVYDFLQAASWVYAFFATLAIGDKIYKWAKLTFTKKQDILK